MGRPYVHATWFVYFVDHRVFRNFANYIHESHVAYNMLRLNIMQRMY